MIHFKDHSRLDNFEIDRTHPLSNGLLLAAVNKEVGTPLMFDSSVYGRNGTLSNMRPASDWVWDAQIRRWTLNFESARTERVLFGDHSDFNPELSDFSVSAWIKTTASTGIIIAKRNLTTEGFANNVGWALYVSSGPARMLLTISGDSTNYNIPSVASVNDGAWHHLVGVRRGTTVEVWVDGIVATAASGTGTINPTNQLTIGAQTPVITTNTFDGPIADVLIWQRALQVSEIMALGSSHDPSLSGLLYTPHRKLFLPPSVSADYSVNVYDAISIEESATVLLPELFIDTSDTVSISESVVAAVEDCNVVVGDDIAIVDAPTAQVSDPQVDVYDAIAIEESATVTIEVVSADLSIDVYDAVSIAEATRHDFIKFIQWGGYENGASEAGGSGGSIALVTTPINVLGYYALRCNPRMTETAYSTHTLIGPDGRWEDDLDLETSFVRFYVYISTLPSADSETIFSAVTASPYYLKCELHINSDGSLTLYNNTVTAVATSTTQLSLSTWYRIELKVGTGTSSPYELRIDGATEFSGTANQSTLNLGRFYLGKRPDRNGETYDIYFDDWAIAEYGFPGIGYTASIVNSFPTADGGIQQWDQGTNSSNWQEVNNTDNAQYVKNQAATNQIALFQFATLAAQGAGGYDVLGIVVVTYSRLVAGFANALRHRIYSGANYVESASPYSSTGSRHFLYLYSHTDPNTGLSWDESSAEDAEIGVIEGTSDQLELIYLRRFVHVTPFVGTTINVNDAITISEDVTVIVSTADAYDIDVFDALTLSDVAVVENPLLPLSTYDQVSLAEAVTLLLGIDVNVNDSIALADSGQAEVYPVDVSVFDAVTITESSVVVVIGADLSISVYDLINITEDVTVSLSAVGTYDVDVYDTITLSELASVVLPDALAISVYDAVAIAESVSLWLTSATDFAVNVYDTISLAEKVSVWGEFAEESSIRFEKTERAWIVRVDGIDRMAIFDNGCVTALEGARFTSATVYAYGNANEYFGVGAGFAELGEKNTFVGYYAGGGSVSGDGNVALGYAAGYNSGAGSDNINIGNSAGVGAWGTSREQNVAIGSNALQVGTGNRNVALGYGAGLATTSGNDNVLLGCNAGSTLTTGDHNIIIGASAEPPTISGDYQLNIGNLISGSMDSGSEWLGFFYDKPFRFGASADVILGYDGTDAYLKTANQAPSDVRIDCGTERTLQLDVAVWDDLQFAISEGQVPTSSGPNWEAFTTNTNEYAFDVGEYIDLGSRKYPNWFAEGTYPYFYATFAIKTANSSGASQWVQLQIHVAYQNTATGIWTETNAYAEKEIPSGASAKQGYYLSLGQWPASGLGINQQTKIRVKRIAAVSGPEYGDSVFVTMVGMHCKKDTLGSRTERQKTPTYREAFKYETITISESVSVAIS